MRLLRTIGIIIGTYLVGIVLVAVAAEFLTWFGVNDSDFTVENFSPIAILLVVFPFFGSIAPKVGYRLRDVLFLFIPFYGIFWMFRIAHRFTCLPKEDRRLKRGDGMRFFKAVGIIIGGILGFGFLFNLVPVVVRVFT